MQWCTKIDKYEVWWRAAKFSQLFKRLYGEDYFDRMRSLSKSKAETAIINVGGERHEVIMVAPMVMALIAVREDGGDKRRWLI